MHVLIRLSSVLFYTRFPNCFSNAIFVRVSLQTRHFSTLLHITIRLLYIFILWAPICTAAREPMRIAAQKHALLFGRRSRPYEPWEPNYYRTRVYHRNVCALDQLYAILIPCNALSLCQSTFA